MGNFTSKSIKVLMFFFVSVCTFLVSNAQPLSYSYTPLTGLTYTDFTTGAGNQLPTAGPTGDDASTNVTLPFTFTYAGNAYTVARFCTNGWVAFAGGTSNSFTAGNLFSTTAPNATIGAWFRDGNANAANGGVLASGPHPSLTDVYVFQFKNMASSGSGGTSATNVVNVQVWLYGPGSSNPGRIQIRYGSAGAGISTGASIGIEAPTSGSGNWINALNGSTTSTATTTAWVGNGNGYQFDPVIITCGAPTGLGATGVTATSANLGWTAPSIGTVASYDWEVRSSGSAGSGPAGLVDFGNVATNSASTASLSANVTTYNLYVRTNCSGGAGQSTWTGPFVFNTPVTNDACVNAIPITCNTFYSSTTVGSTADAVPNCHATGTGLTGVWYKYVGNDNEVTINLCNTITNYDTKISVFTGDCVGGFTCYASNDDLGAACTTGVPTTGFRSAVTFNAYSGSDYYILIHGWSNTSTGLFSFTPSCNALCVPVPGNETCAAAQALGALPTSCSGTTVTNNCAGAAAVAPSGQSAFGTFPDIWYSFTAPPTGDAVVRLTLNGTATAAGFEIYSDCIGTSVAYVPSVTSGTSYVTTGLIPGNTYYLQLYSDQSARGSFDFCIYYEACPTPLNGTATSISYNQAVLGWTSTGSLFDIELGSAGFTPTGTPTQSGVTNNYTYMGLSASTAYSFYVRQDCGAGIYSTWNGPFNFSTTINCSTIPSIGTCGSSFPVNIAAGTGNVDVLCDGLFSTPGKEVYYAFTAPTTGSYSFTNASSGGVGGAFDYVHVYNKLASSGCGATGWTSVYCDFLANDGTTSTTFALTGGTQYFFLFDGEGTNAVSLNLTINCPPPPPVNDPCSGAITVSCGSVVTGNTLNSTIDGPSTTCSGSSLIAPDNWYKIVGNGATITASLCGAATDYDTRLDIYTGSCGSLSCVGSNDDFCGLASQISWPSTIGTIYLIRVHGFDGEIGNYELAITCAGGPNTWIGNSNNWFDPNNWTANTVPTVCADNAQIPTSPVGGSFPIITNVNPAATVGNLIMDNGSQLTLSGQTLTVCNNFVGGLGTGGTVVSVTNGSLIMGGSANQSISGNANVDVMVINNPGNTIAVQNGSSLRINEELRLQQGTFANTLGGSAILGSTASRTANLNDFCGGCTGTYSGDVTAERYVTGVSGFTYNQHHIGSPVNAPAFSGLADDLSGGLSGSYPGVNNVFVTPLPSCDPDFLAVSSNYGNVFEWEETGPFGTGVFPNSCYQAGFKVRSAGNMENGVGYVINSPAANTVDLTGAPNTGNITVNGLTNSNYTNSAVNNFVTQSGWNELGNPYPSSVSLSPQAGIDPGIAIWHTSGKYTGTFQPASLGVDANLAPWQGFWARKTAVGGTASFNFSQAQRTITQNNYYKVMGANTLLLEVTGFGFADATYVQFDNNATPNYDLGLDVEKILGGHKQPRLFTYQSAMPDVRLAVNTIADGAQNNSIPVVMIPGANGTHNFEALGITSFDPTQYIFLEDKVTGAMQNLRSNPNYSFTMTKTENPDRFVLHFTPAAQFSTVAVTCNSLGAIELTQPGDASWSFAITDANYNLIGSGTLDKNHPQSIPAQAGVHTITMIDNNGYTVVKNVNVAGTQTVLSDFNVGTANPVTNEAVDFYSSATNAVSYNWEFGDGTIITGVANPSVSFAEPGTYVVTLTVTNADGCVSTSSQTVVVAVASGVTTLANIPVTMWSAGNKVFVDFTKQKNVNATIEVYNILGQQLVNDHFGKSSIYVNEILDTDAAYVIVKVMNDDKTTIKKLFVSNR